MPQVAEARVALTLDLPDDELPAVLDVDRIERVLINLVTNAIKFTPPGGTIRVRARQVDDCLRCEVTDTGVGIPKEDQSKLFLRFSQLGEAPRKGGTGLGLSITKAIVEAHGGHVGVESEPGQGSTFWFALPASPAES
jgi:signal transduction histidine kinase